MAFTTALLSAADNSHDCSKYSNIQNHIVNSTITYILDSKQFDCSVILCKAPLFIYSKVFKVPLFH